MGKLALILSAAATLMLTSMMIGVQRSSFETTHISANYEEEVLAREIASSALNAVASKVRREYDTERPQNDVSGYMGGSFDAYASGSSAGPVVVSATGVYGDASYTVQAKLTRLSSLPSAVVVDSDTTEVNFVGSDFLITGKDTRPTSETENIPEGSGWGTPAGGVWTRTNDVMAAFTEPLDNGLEERVRGLTEQENVINASIPIDLDQLYEEAVANADETYDGDQVFSTNESFGSADYPTIVVVDGSVTLTGNVEGYGMLVVNGDFDMQANARWNGIVLVSGEGDLYVTHEGSSVVFGSVLVRHERGEGEAGGGDIAGGDDDDGGGSGIDDDDDGGDDGGIDDDDDDDGGDDDGIDNDDDDDGDDDGIDNDDDGDDDDDGIDNDDDGDGEVEFDIDDDEVVPQECFNASVTVLGAAISASGVYDLMVTTEFNVGGDVYAPWGSLNLPVDSNVNDDQNPRTYMVEEDYPAGTAINITGRAWLKKRSWYSGDSNNHWQTYMTVDSEGGSSNVIVLRDGDPVPDISGFMGQNDIMYFVEPYVDNGMMVLDPNQVIYLFELGTTNLNSSAADFQDLVTLVTLSEGEGCASSMNTGEAPGTELPFGVPPTLEDLIAQSAPAAPAEGAAYPELSNLRAAGFAGFPGFGDSTICHVETNTTMEVGFFDALAHILHGDYWGACEADDEGEYESDDDHDGGYESDDDGDDHDGGECSDDDDDHDGGECGDDDDDDHDGGECGDDDDDDHDGGECGDDDDDDGDDDHDSGECGDDDDDHDDGDHDDGDDDHDDGDDDHDDDDDGDDDDDDDDDCGGDEEEDDDGGENKVTICHIPPGNADNAHTIIIGEPAVDAHLAHGDYVGVCAESNGSDDDDDEYEEDDDGGDDDGGDFDGGEEDDGDEGAEVPRGALHFTMQNQAQIYYSTETIGKLASRLSTLRSTSWIVAHDQWSGKSGQ
ncbi:hypothetical protein [Rhodocaloribacter sp.]